MTSVEVASACNLDALLRVSLRAELLRLHRELVFTALHITHDQEEAFEMRDRVVLMRDGRIEQIGLPQAVYTAGVALCRRLSRCS